MTCEICNHNQFQKLYTLSKITLCRCNHCKVIVGAERKPFKGEENDDWANDIENIEEYYESQFQRKNSEYLDFLKSHGVIKVDKLLDIGCAYGAFLNEAQKKGWQVTGVELSPTACRIAQEKYKLQPYNQPYTEELFADQTFQVITLFDVIEHISNPRLFLQSIYRDLTDEGYLLLTVPNFSSLTSKLCIWSYYLSLKKFSLAADLMTQVTYNSHHIWYFNKSSLETFLLKEGFRLVAMKSMTTLFADAFVERKDFKSWPWVFRWLLKNSIQFVQAIERIFSQQDTLLVLAQKQPREH